jgi:hypothetical protein
LNALLFGLENNPTPQGENEALPVRTMILRLRPDIMSGVVMDALQEACEQHPTVTARVLKRRDGHFQCLIIPNGIDDVEEASPAYLVDANICTSRRGALERQLLLRIFHAGVEETKRKKKKSPKNKASNNDQTDPPHRSNSSTAGLLILDNLRLRDACSFLQYIRRHHPNVRNPMELPSPRDAPKASTAFFAGSYEPTYSVQLAKELKTTPTCLYSSLNSEDWALLQSSWPMISRMWKNLSMQNCVFHTVEEIPLVEPDQRDESGELSGPILDLHYCSQIRHLSREGMLDEIRSSFHDLRTNLREMEASYANFIHMLQHSWAKFHMMRYKAPPGRRTPQLDMPNRICPPGYTILAALACKCARAEDVNDPTALCDDAVRKVYKTFCSQDDHTSRKNLKEANKAVMERLVEIQNTQMTLVEQLETHQNTQGAAKQFVKMARQATNTKGRVERLVLAKVPLLDLGIIGGNCQITSTAMLCTTSGIFGTKCHYFDLKAVDFVIKSGNCLSIVLVQSREAIYKIHTATDLPSLTRFLKTLKTLQSVFAIKTKPQAMQNDVETL